MKMPILALVALAASLSAVSTGAELSVEERIRGVERAVAPPLQIGRSSSWTIGDAFRFAQRGC